PVSQGRTAGRRRSRWARCSSGSTARTAPRSARTASMVTGSGSGARARTPPWTGSGSGPEELARDRAGPTELHVGGGAVELDEGVPDGDPDLRRQPLRAGLLQRPPLP